MKRNKPNISLYGWEDTVDTLEWIAGNVNTSFSDPEERQTAKLLYTTCRNGAYAIRDLAEKLSTSEKARSDLKKAYNKLKCFTVVGAVASAMYVWDNTFTDQGKKVKADVWYREEKDK